MLLYNLEQGPSEKAILKKCYRSKWPVPKVIKEAPELNSGLDLYFDAFYELTKYRSFGFVENPISWSDVNNYCLFHDIDGYQRDNMFRFISAMDRVYLNFRSKSNNNGKA